MQVDHELGGLNGIDGDMQGGLKPLGPNVRRENSRGKAFWRELQAMIRLRSPHTVNVYGAITSRQGCYILVMELLPGGDLRALLKNSVEALAEQHARRIIQDVCAGMAFLHRKEAVHGDLKSPNVLFDVAGRAKVKPGERTVSSKSEVEWRYYVEYTRICEHWLVVNAICITTPNTTRFSVSMVRRVPGRHCVYCTIVSCLMFRSTTN